VDRNGLVHVQIGTIMQLVTPTHILGQVSGCAANGDGSRPIGGIIIDTFPGSWPGEHGAFFCRDGGYDVYSDHLSFHTDI
jgi:hypothetical protein